MGPEQYDARCTMRRFTTWVAGALSWTVGAVAASARPQV